jgi:hypothetical protein
LEQLYDDFKVTSATTWADLPEVETEILRSFKKWFPIKIVDLDDNTIINHSFKIDFFRGDQNGNQA